MTDNPMSQPCPDCGTTQEPILVIRSSGVPGRNRWVFRCGSCQPDGTYRATPSVERAASAWSWRRGVTSRLPTSVGSTPWRTTSHDRPFSTTWTPRSDPAGSRC